MVSCSHFLAVVILNYQNTEGGGEHEKHKGKNEIKSGVADSNPAYRKSGRNACAGCQQRVSGGGDNGRLATSIVWDTEQSKQQGELLMTESVIVAAFSLIGTLLGTLSGARLTKYRIEQLEKKVDKHNGVIERMYAMEESMAVIDEKVRVANHRIEDLERVTQEGGSEWQ